MGVRVLLTVLLLAQPACGEAPPPVMSASVTISAALSELVRSLKLYVLGPRRSDNIVLTCSTLLQDGAAHIEPTDARVEQLASREIAFDAATRSFALAEVAAGSDRLVFVGAYDAAGLLVGRGCKEQQEVPSGGSVDVLVRVFPLQ